MEEGKREGEKEKNSKPSPRWPPPTNLTLARSTQLDTSMFYATLHVHINPFKAVVDGDNESLVRCQDNSQHSPFFERPLMLDSRHILASSLVPNQDLFVSFASLPLEPCLAALALGCRLLGSLPRNFA